MLIKITVPNELIEKIDKARKTESRASFFRRAVEKKLEAMQVYRDQALAAGKILGEQNE